MEFNARGLCIFWLAIGRFAANFLWNGMQSSPLERVKRKKNLALYTVKRQSKGTRVKLPGLPLF